MPTKTRSSPLRRRSGRVVGLSLIALRGVTGAKSKAARVPEATTGGSSARRCSLDPFCPSSHVANWRRCSAGADLRPNREETRPALLHPALKYVTNRALRAAPRPTGLDRKSTRLNSSHITISYAVFCLKKKKKKNKKSYIINKKKKKK